MEKILEIDLNDKEKLFETYNSKKVSKELIQYMIDSMPKLKKNDTLKIIINNNLKEKIRGAELIKKALDEACEKNEFRFHSTNVKQFSFLIMGIFALGLSTIVKIDVLKEVVIIGAWVLLWDALEMEIVDDLITKKKRKILKKLLDSEFIENIK